MTQGSVKALSTEQIKLVQSTFDELNALDAAPLFYDRLFELDPDIKKLFARTDMFNQGRKFIEMIALIVGGLYDFDSVVPQIEALAIRHIGYGVKDEYYATVGEAMIWMLEQSLKKKFTTERHEAWIAFYDVITHTALDAVKDLQSTRSTEDE